MTRTIWIYGAMALALLALIGLHLSLWSGPLDWQALREDRGVEREILLHFRLPRVLLAALSGAVLGLSGSTLQTLLRNPLASPDVIGFGAGAAAGAAAAIIVAGSLSLVWSGALLGGALTTALVLWLARSGGLPPNSLILIGVACSLMLTAATDVLLSFSPGIQAAETARFLTGGFSGADWPSVSALTLTALIGGGLLAWQSYTVDRMDMGDDIALSHGLRIRRTRLITLATAAAMVSVSVAVTGPLPFLAFLAGPLARALLAQNGCVLPAAAAVGAILALSAEGLSRSGLTAMQLPAGLYTAAVGGAAMLLIVFRKRRFNP